MTEQHCAHDRTVTTSGPHPCEGGVLRNWKICEIDVSLEMLTRHDVDVSCGGSF